MEQQKKAALILEGGGNRGVFTAGVLDYLLEREEEFSYVAGVSAGACNAMDYVSRQIGRTRDCMIVTEKENRYLGTKEVLKKGRIIDMDMVFSVYPYETFPFDFQTYFHSKLRCEMVVTNCLTGEAEYLSEDKDEERLLSICRASSSIPVMSPEVFIDGCPYVDGGVADSVPLIHAMKEGYRKNVVILTRNPGYRKSRPGKSRALYVAALKKYPNLLNVMVNRYRSYNRTMEMIEKWEAEGKIFVLRPQVEPVSRLEGDPKKLTGFYQHGYELMRDSYDKMLDYLHDRQEG
ncbi:MAG: patatin family protein [Eubacteriales bacterium]|nr:patatin family protein [Eubacteriales bacterium]